MKNVSDFRVNDVVEHEVYGRGEVINIENSMLEVEFYNDHENLHCGESTDLDLKNRFYFFNGDEGFESDCVCELKIVARQLTIEDYSIVPHVNSSVKARLEFSNDIIVEEIEDGYSTTYEYKKGDEVIVVALAHSYERNDEGIEGDVYIIYHPELKHVTLVHENFLEFIW